MELVSVIVPTYNAGEYIGDCIQSLLAQTYKNLEIIIVDDGSTDDTADKCLAFCSKDSRIHYHKQNNSGVAIARNAGLDFARGKYIIFIDADDELHFSMIEKLVGDIEKYDVDISVCDIYRIANSYEKKHIILDSDVELYNQDDALNLFMSKNYFEIGAWNKLFKKSILDDVRFVSGRRMNEDKFFVFEAFMKANSISYRKEPLYYYYVRPQSATKRTFDDRWFDNQYFAEQIYYRILDEKYYLESAARIQYILTLYYLILVMKRCGAVEKYKREYKSIVKEIRAIPLKGIHINKKTMLGIILLKRCEFIFDILQAKK